MVLKNNRQILGFNLETRLLPALLHVTFNIYTFCFYFRQKEESLRSSLDPKYAHLSDELHVEISALAPPAEAHARIAYALAEVKKYLIPDANDMMRQTQMRDIMERG